MDRMIGGKRSVVRLSPIPSILSNPVKELLTSVKFDVGCFRPAQAQAITAELEFKRVA